MSPRVCFGVAAIALILSLAAGVILWNALRSGTEYRSLRRQAMDAGMTLTLPKAVVDKDVARLMESVSKEYAYISGAASANSLNQFRSLVELGSSTHSILHEVADREPRQVRWTDNALFDLHRSSRLCVFNALIALNDNRPDAFFEELGTLRRLMHAFPISDSDAASSHTYLLEAYCELSQFAAEHARAELFIRTLQADAEKLRAVSFHLVASNLAANMLEGIDVEQAERRTYREEPLDLAATVNRSEPSMNDRRAGAIQAGLTARANWDRMHDILDLQNRQGHASSVVARLKVREIGCTLVIHALRATLRAHLNRTIGKPWPTMDDLELEGFVVTHPVNGERFEWSTTSAKRVSSLAHCDETTDRRVVIGTNYQLRSDWGSELVSRLRAKQ